MDNCKYAVKEYWNERFAQETNFEWCGCYGDFQPLIREHIAQSDRILILGCGNSRLGADMYQDGFTKITNIDYSDVVIKKMAAVHKDMPEMLWKEMDITKLAFDENSFDVVLEKGTLDSLLVGEVSPWQPSVYALDLMDDVLAGVSGILSPGGKFISITFAQPHFRVPFYARAKGERYGWDVNIRQFGEHFHFFFYVCEKGNLPNDRVLKLEENFINRRHASPHKNNEEKLIETVKSADEFLHNISL